MGRTKEIRSIQKDFVKQYHSRCCNKCRTCKHYYENTEYEDGCEGQDMTCIHSIGSIMISIIRNCSRRVQAQIVCTRTKAVC